MNKVLIVGHGYVGSAVSSIFNKDEKIIIDPKLNSKQIKDYATCNLEVVFVCVDTPKNENFSTLNSVLKDINLHLKKDTVVCAKSTATPEFYTKAASSYKNIKLVFYPEYLSHWSNIKDFKSQKFVILGGPEPACRKIKKILKPRLKNAKKYYFTTIDTAALVKYAENAFLALKVTFANELFLAFKKLKIKSSFQQLTSLLGKDERIGPSHMQVPGRDGKYGWGGHCYEKDNHEFQKITGSKLVKFMIELNKHHRSQ